MTKISKSVAPMERPERFITHKHPYTGMQGSEPNRYYYLQMQEYAAHLERSNPDLELHLRWKGDPPLLDVWNLPRQKKTLSFEDAEGELWEIEYNGSSVEMPVLDKYVPFVSAKSLLNRVVRTLKVSKYREYMWDPEGVSHFQLVNAWTQEVLSTVEINRKS